MTLAARSGLPRLLADMIDIPKPRIKSGSANPAPKLATLIAGMCGGADCIHDVDLVRSGGMKTLFGGVCAPSTIGTLLREFTFGHARQLESVLRHHLAGLRELVELLPLIRGFMTSIRCDHRPAGRAPGQRRPLPRRPVPGLALSPVCHRYHRPGRAGRRHPPPPRDHRNRPRRPHRRPARPHAHGRFGANSTWILYAAISHNLLRAAGEDPSNTYPRTGPRPTHGKPCGTTPSVINSADAHRR